MSVRDMEALFRPRGVAVAAADGGGPLGQAPLTRALIRNLTASGTGVPVTRGIPPASPCDLWVAAVAPEAQPALIAQAGANGARVVLLVGAHTPGGDDARHHAAIRDASRAAGVRVVGPDSLGIALPTAGRRLIAGAFHRPPRAGRVALVSQSGTLAGSILDWAARRDVGFSHVAVLGGMADVGPDELLNALAMQGDCHAVLLALDRIRDARRFMSAARAASRLKPVIVLHTPTGDAAAEPVIDAAFRRAGLLRAGTLESLFDALEILDVAPALKGNRLAIAANGRGVGALAARALAATGGRLAHPAAGTNPLDLGEGADGAAYGAALARLRADPGVDGVLLLHAPTVESDAAAVARAVADACAGPGHPVLTSWLGDRDAERVLPDLARRHVPAFDTPDRAVRAFCQGAAWRTVQALLTETPPASSPGPAPDHGGALAVMEAAGLRATLTTAEAADLCRCYGLPAAGVEGTGLTVRLDTDPLFGPVIAVQAGMGESSAVSVLPPLNATLARETLMRLPGVALLDPALIAPLAGVLVRVAHMAADLERLESLTLSPTGASATLVPPGRERTPFAILPYPAALEQALPLPDGRRLLVRPVRPEDEPGLQALFRRLTPQEIRLRFFAPKQELTHSVAARMSQIDYHREMGLVVTDAGDGGTIHGAVHLSGDGDGERAEFAIMVAHDMAGLGLGPLLMRRIIDHGRSRGLRAIIGEVLAENRPMLRLCEVLGFTRRSTPDDPGVIHVTLTL